MKIISVHVVSFGKLTNVRLNFNSGLNVIKEANSFGKTTLAGFIRAMLYGFTYTRTKGATDVSHFAPWNSAGKFGGSMLVEQRGETYRIERFFGATARQETLTVTNEKTGKELTWPKQPGEMLLGLTAESYDRSAYFPQEAVELSTNENLDSRLANLVEDGAEDYEKVQDRLRAYKKTLRFERGQGGVICELERRRLDLTDSLHRTQNGQRRAAEIDKRLAEIENDKTALKKRQAEYAEQLTRLQGTVVANQPTETQQQPQQATNKIWLYMGVALTVVGIVFLALGFAHILGTVGYVVGVIGAVLGICGIATHIALGILAKRRAATQTPQQQPQQIEQQHTDNVQNYLNVVTAISQQMSELAAEAGRLSEERKGLALNGVEIMDELLAVEEQHKNAIHRYEVAETVSKLLEQAKENLSSSYLPKLCARCTELLQQITRGDYTVTVDRSFTVSIREHGQTKPISEFSRGIREITLLCFRVALSELLYDGAIPFVIVDDAFVNFDEANFTRATALLKSLQAHAQVIYFTCHDRTGELLK